MFSDKYPILESHAGCSTRPPTVSETCEKQEESSEALIKSSFAGTDSASSTATLNNRSACVLLQASLWQVPALVSDLPCFSSVLHHAWRQGIYGHQWLRDSYRNGLKDDVVCLTPNATVKSQIRKKFEAKEGSLKALLDERMVEVLSLASVPSVPEPRALPSKVNISDLKANLADEWTGSLQALFQVVVKSAVTEELMHEAAGSRDFYVRKVKASLDAFEQQLSDRIRPSGAFDTIDFSRQSLEADPPFEGDAIGQARSNKLQNDLAQAEDHIAKLEAELDKLDKILQARDRQIAELEKQQAPLSYVADILGCAGAEIHQSVDSLVSKVTALEIDNDQLRNQINNDASLQDHSACQQQINDLQSDLHLEKLNTASSATTIKSLRDTITSLRDQLSKQGIGGSLEDRLRQLGFINGSASSVIDNRCGSDGND